MISPIDRKKIGFPLLVSHNNEMKKYTEVYGLFIESGYTRELCAAYADAFIDNVKKPAPFDIIQLASLYDRIFDHKTAILHLEKLSDKKLSNDDRFFYCTEVLKAFSKIGNWREAVDFRTANISFLQRYTEKTTLKKEAELYMALALTDCAAKKYKDAFKLLKFGYKPQGANDFTLLEIFITVVYIYAKAEDEEGLQGAIQNAQCCLNLFKQFNFPWQKEYYEQRIESAAKCIL